MVVLERAVVDTSATARIESEVATCNELGSVAARNLHGLC
jgi:hypothetical protein